MPPKNLSLGSLSFKKLEIDSAVLIEMERLVHQQRTVNKNDLASLA